jgi:hypothetical protein
MDRLYHLWADCNGYDAISSDQLGKSQYEAVNPISGTDPARNPYTLTAFTVGLDEKIPFAWEKVDSGSLIFPFDNWPTPRQLWSCGTDGKRGHAGMYYRYGTDQIVRAFSRSCPDAESWTLVDVGYTWAPNQKRDVILHPRMHNLVDTYEAKLNEGKSHKTVLFEMAKTECELAPKNDIDELFLSWIKMSNHVPEAYDSICDKPSLRLKMKEEKDEVPLDINVKETGTTVPLWAILVASICSGLIVIAIVVFIIISIRRQSAGSDYTRMDS